MAKKTPIFLVLFSFLASQLNTCYSEELSAAIQRNGQPINAPTNVDTEKVVTIEGKNIELTCIANGTPLKNVMWFRNGIELDEMRFMKISRGNVRIPHVSISDAGEYTCVADDELRKVELIVKQKTQFDEKQNGQLVIESGTTATICFDVFVDPTLKIDVRWSLSTEGTNVASDRFVQMKNPYCLEIRNATINDSRFYACNVLLRSPIDSQEIDGFYLAKHLIVRDSSAQVDTSREPVASVPNSPKILGGTHYNNDVTLWWQPPDIDHPPVHNYTVQYMNDWIKDWTTFDHTLGNQTYANIKMKPGTDYKFRVIAYNEFGASKPSKITPDYESSPDIPYRDPSDVQVAGTMPTNLVISWTPMNKSEHNARNFFYKILWKQHNETKWNVERVSWKHNRIVIQDQPTFTRYSVCVKAVNKFGNSNGTATIINSFSGESKPTQAPSNFSLIESGGNWAVLHWDPVPRKSVMGHFENYLIDISCKSEDDYVKQIEITDLHATGISIRDLHPNTTNTIVIYVTNQKYLGPDSDTIIIKTAPFDPNGFQSFQAFPSGAEALLLRWTRPFNRHISGYKILYREIGANKLQPVEGELKEIIIDNQNTSQTKLAGLKSDTEYRVYIAAVKSNDAIDKQMVEVRTLREGPLQPDAPSFLWQHLEQDNDTLSISIKVIWMPPVYGVIGSEFFVKYRVKNESHWNFTHREENNDFVVIHHLSPHQIYEVVIVSVDGEFETESQIQKITTRDIEPNSESDTSSPISVLNIALASTALFLFVIYVSIRIYFTVKKIRLGVQSSGNSETTTEV